MATEAAMARVEKGNDGNDNGKGEGQDGGLGGNNGFGGGDNDNGGGSDGAGGDDGRGADSDTGAGRRGDASSAFGGEDEGSIAGKVGSGSTTTAGQDKSADEKSESSEESRGVAGAITDAISQGYQTVSDSLAGMMGFGKEVSKGTPEQRATDFARGLLSEVGVVSPAPDINTGRLSPEWGSVHTAPSATPAASVQAERRAGAQVGVNTIGMEAVLGSPVSMVANQFSKTRMTPEEKFGFDSVRSAKLGSLSNMGISYGAQLAEVPGKIADMGIGIANVALASEKAKNTFGVRSSFSQSRRNSAVSAFSGNERATANTMPPKLTTSWKWEPASYGVGNYGSHVKGLMF